MARLRRTRKREHGQALVLFALSLVVIMLFASIVIDVGMLRTDTARLQNALDAGALAASQQLPTTGAASAGVTTLAQTFVHNNYPPVSTGSVSVAYDCLIHSTTTGTAGVYGPKLTDIALECANFPSAGPWTCNSTTCFAPCNPTAVGTSSGTTQTCNMLGVTATSTQPYTFGGVVGIKSGTVNGAGSGNGNPVSYAANSPSPIDVVLIIDRTGSMSGVDTQNAQTAADAVRTLYDGTSQWLAMGFLGPSFTSTNCPSPYAAAHVVPDTSIGTANAGDVSRWIPVGLSGIGAPVNQNYNQDGLPYNTTAYPSTLSKAIGCFALASVGNSSTQTDLADPISMATQYLTSQNDGRRKGIILETDGQANTHAPGSYPNNTPCTNAVNAALAAKAAGIEIYTIGFGLDNKSGDNPTCSDNGQTARATLVSMASSYAHDFAAGDANACYTSSDTSYPAPTGQTEHFYCVPKSGVPSNLLADIFTTAAGALASGGHLVQLPVPPPVIATISPIHGPLIGGTPITLTGQYFTTAYSVAWGAGSVPFTIVSDTQITLTSPSGATGPVSITVTNPGGPSNIVTYTYP